MAPHRLPKSDSDVEVITEKTSVYLTRQEIEDIVTTAVARAFRDVGLSAGDGTTFEEAKAVRADLQFLRDWRELCELMRHKGIATGILMTMTALGVVLVLGLRSWFFQ